jgi:hypothetical protein
MVRYPILRHNTPPVCDICIVTEGEDARVRKL